MADIKTLAMSRYGVVGNGTDSTSKTALLNSFSQNPEDLFYVVAEKQADGALENTAISSRHGQIFHKGVSFTSQVVDILTAKTVAATKELINVAVGSAVEEDKDGKLKVIGDATGTTIVELPITKNNFAVYRFNLNGEIEKVDVESLYIEPDKFVEYLTRVDENSKNTEKNVKLLIDFVNDRVKTLASVVEGIDERLADVENDSEKLKTMVKEHSVHTIDKVDVTKTSGLTTTGVVNAVVLTDKAETIKDAWDETCAAGSHKEIGVLVDTHSLDVDDNKVITIKQGLKDNVIRYKIENTSVKDTTNVETQQASSYKLYYDTWNFTTDAWNNTWNPVEDSAEIKINSDLFVKKTEIVHKIHAANGEWIDCSLNDTIYDHENVSEAKIHQFLRLWWSNSRALDETMIKDENKDSQSTTTSKDSWYSDIDLSDLIEIYTAGKSSDDVAYISVDENAFTISLEIEKVAKSKAIANVINENTLPIKKSVNSLISDLTSEIETRVANENVLKNAITSLVSELGNQVTNLAQQITNTNATITKVHDHLVSVTNDVDALASDYANYKLNVFDVLKWHNLIEPATTLDKEPVANLYSQSDAPDGCVDGVESYVPDNVETTVGAFETTSVKTEPFAVPVNGENA